MFGSDLSVLTPTSFFFLCGETPCLSMSCMVLPWQMDDKRERDEINLRRRAALDSSPQKDIEWRKSILGITITTPSLRHEKIYLTITSMKKVPSIFLSIDEMGMYWLSMLLSLDIDMWK